MRSSAVICAVAALSLMALPAAEEALGQAPPPLRKHSVTQSEGGLELVPANVPPPGPSRVSITTEGRLRVILSNGLPDHLVGRFPNRGNPNGIRPQSYVFDMPVDPQPAARVTPLGLFDFGIAVDGVPFDPGAAEWYKGDPRGEWRYAALSGAVPLGLDQNYGHVQPNGAYHYHGLPTGLLNELGISPTTHSPIVGWAADGYPIYALYGFADPAEPAKGIETLESSYHLRPGRRPEGGLNPGGTYDGTFVADYEYVEGLGDLDECNGRWTVTPEFPQGTYAYFLTEHWPVIPRCYKGTPSKSFTEQRRRH